ncbi:MAG TPA: molybdenum cofactor biosynthesis protein MoaE [Solirubrobacteraceae bacterium]|jgi:molybdopterin synthase catalytic subunit|nr:molybdenum cofactor biosynthesis protein MoaE [Solirubrobacteraceae bacterium]
MQVRVRLFAILRERAGFDELQLELPEGATVGDALEQLRPVAGDLKVVMAVNRDYADASATLHEHDELALIPPVSGGAATASRVTTEPLDVSALNELVRDPRAGAIVIFEGVTRTVDHLDYEAYAEMAEQRIAEIVTQAIETHGLCAAAAEHRIGAVPLAEPSVIVAASAPHRGEAFAGAREIIDRIKAECPIWKREEGEWVEGQSPSA